MDNPENIIDYDEEDGLDPNFEFGFFNDNQNADEILRKLQDEDLRDQPLHQQAKAGFAEISWGGWPLPDDKELGLMRQPKFVEAGGLTWNGLTPPARVRVLKAIGAAPHHAIKDDIWDYIDAWQAPVKVWLAGWQRQMINTGRCWHLPGRFGGSGYILMSVGCVMAAPKRNVGYYGHTHPARDEIAPGKRGSAAYVLEKMGQRYLDWISSIE